MIESLLIIACTEGGGSCSGESQEHGQGAIDREQGHVVQVTDDRPYPRPTRRLRLVDHDLRRLGQPVLWGRDREQRR